MKDTTTEALLTDQKRRAYLARAYNAGRLRTGARSRNAHQGVRRRLAARRR